MLSKDEILEKINHGESSGVEFKEVILKRGKIQLNNGDLSDEIAAFANHKGGLIIFGIKDKTNQIIGIDDDVAKEIITLLSSICKDLIKPSLVDFYIDTSQIINFAGKDKNLVYIEIDKSLWLHESKHGHFYRHGNSKRKMATEHILRIGQVRSQARIIYFDEQLVPNTGIEILQKDLYQRFISKQTTDDEITALLKRKILAKTDDTYQVSVAGLLMCSNQPDEYLYNSFIQIVYYNSITKDANYQIDAKDFKGSLDAQIIDTIKFIEKYNKVSAIKPMGRIDRPQYSMKAVFEAVVNAVVHRDYAKHGSKIRISLLNDRLEISSPGALANTLTIETMPLNQTTRNELLSRLLSEIEANDDIKKIINRQFFLERRGIGIRIILDESEKLSGKKPLYEMQGEELKLTIFAAKSFQDDDEK